MESSNYIFPELHRSLCQDRELTDHLTRLTKNLAQEVKLTLEGKSKIEIFQMSMPLCCMVFSNNFDQTENNKKLRWMLN